MSFPQMPRDEDEDLRQYLATLGEPEGARGLPVGEDDPPMPPPELAMVAAREPFPLEDDEPPAPPPIVDRADVFSRASKALPVDRPGAVTREGDDYVYQGRRFRNPYELEVIRTNERNAAQQRRLAETPGTGQYKIAHPKPSDVSGSSERLAALRTGPKPPADVSTESLDVKARAMFGWPFDDLSVAEQSQIVPRPDVFAKAAQGLPRKVSRVIQLKDGRMAKVYQDGTVEYEGEARARSGGGVPDAPTELPPGVELNDVQQARWNTIQRIPQRDKKIAAEDRFLADLQREEANAERRDAQTQRDIANETENWGKESRLRGTDRALPALEAVEDELAMLPDDVPGYGLTGPLPNVAISAKGKEIRRKVNELLDTKLRVATGAAAPPGEFRTFREILGVSDLSTDADLRSAVKQARAVIERQHGYISEMYPRANQSRWYRASGAPTPRRGRFSNPDDVQ